MISGKQILNLPSIFRKKIIRYHKALYPLIIQQIMTKDLKPARYADQSKHDKDRMHDTRIIVLAFQYLIGIKCHHTITDQYKCPFKADGAAEP